MVFTSVRLEKTHLVFWSCARPFSKQKCRNTSFNVRCFFCHVATGGFKKWRFEFYCMRCMIKALIMFRGCFCDTSVKKAVTGATSALPPPQPQPQRQPQPSPALTPATATVPATAPIPPLPQPSNWQPTPTNSPCRYLTPVHDTTKTPCVCFGTHR